MLRRSAAENKRLGAALAVALVAAALAGAAPAKKQAAPQPLPREPRALAERIVSFLRSDRLPEAREALLLYREIDPGEPTMIYNLACVEARLGRHDAALAALKDAFAAGFADPVGAARDPDLAPLRERDDFKALVSARHDELAGRARAAGLALVQGAWSEPRSLVDNRTGRPPERGASAQVRVRFDARGWELEATVRGAEPSERPPWEGGPGLQVDVVPPGPRAAAGERAFSFGFGRDGEQPVGTALAVEGEVLVQPVQELAPAIDRTAGGRTTWRLRIPWVAHAPYAPPADTVLGLNVFWLPGGGGGRLALVQDPRPQPGAKERRFAPLSLRPATAGEPMLAGQVSEAVPGAEPVEIELAAWLPRPGAGELRLALVDAGGGAASALRITVPVDAVAGENRWRRPLALTKLPDGAYRLEAALVLPAGTLTWTTPLLKLDPGWLAEARRKLAAVRAVERPSVRLRLDAAASGLDARLPRSNPSGLATAIEEAGLMLERSAAGKSVLPESGLFLGAFAGPKGELRPCSLHLPAGKGAGGVLLLLPGPRSPAALAAEIGAAAADLPSPPAVVVPHPRPPGPLLSDLAVNDAEAALAWAAELFGDAKPAVAGIGPGAADALHLCLRAAARCERVLLLVGAGFDPWPGRDDAAIAKVLATHPNRPPCALQPLADVAANDPALVAVQGALATKPEKLAPPPAPGRAPPPGQAAALAARWWAGGRGR